MPRLRRFLAWLAKVFLLLEVVSRRKNFSHVLKLVASVCLTLGDLGGLVNAVPFVTARQSHK